MTRGLAAKPLRFAWRFARNLVCLLPAGRRRLFPPRRLAQHFGPGDARYAWEVFDHHRIPLQRVGFQGFDHMLEVGPGQNLGSGLLWWAWAVGAGNGAARVLLWDVHPNAETPSGKSWVALAWELLTASQGTSPAPITEVLLHVAEGRTQPQVEYLVAPMEDLLRRLESCPRFDLVVSHAALEHVWDIGRLWPRLAALTAPRGWHSHRIDLADHGRREDHFLEMLEWSPAAWWLTMRFIPGALNRWRAVDHRAALAAAGLVPIEETPARRAALPVPREKLSRSFRVLEEAELLTTSLDIIARAGA